MISGKCAMVTGVDFFGIVCPLMFYQFLFSFRCVVAIWEMAGKWAIVPVSGRVHLQSEFMMGGEGAQRTFVDGQFTFYMSIHVILKATWIVRFKFTNIALKTVSLCVSIEVHF